VGLAHQDTRVVPSPARSIARGHAVGAVLREASWQDAAGASVWPRLAHLDEVEWELLSMRRCRRHAEIS